jgi:hypothetical protein
MKNEWTSRAIDLWINARTRFSFSRMKHQIAKQWTKKEGF